MKDQAMSLPSRRSVLLGLGCIGLAGAGCTTTGLAPGAASAFPQSFSSFGIDVSALKAQGLGSFADLVAAATLDELRRSFADRIDPRGPRLVVRLTGIFLTSSPDGGGGDEWWRGGGGGTDSLEGDALAVDSKGRILASHHLLAVRAVHTSILTPDEPGRAVAVAQHYVQWLRRQLIG